MQPSRGPHDPFSHCVEVPGIWHRTAAACRRRLELHEVSDVSLLAEVGEGRPVRVDGEVPICGTSTQSPVSGSQVWSFRTFPKSHVASHPRSLMLLEDGAVITLGYDKRAGV